MIYELYIHNQRKSREKASTCIVEVVNMDTICLDNPRMMRDWIVFDVAIHERTGAYVLQQLKHDFLVKIA